MKPAHLIAAAGLALSVTLPATAQAQALPKAYKWVVPSAPGDGSDIAARLVGDKLALRLGVPVVIDNKPGAGGIIGSETVAKAAPDGATMVMGNAGSHGINAAIYTKLSYDVVKDFAPVALICTAPNVMVVNPGVPARTVTEFITWARANPGKINYASGGVGSSAHLSAELLKSMTGIEMTHVPYKGSVPAVTAVLGGEATLMIGNLPPWSAHIKAGRGRALAVTTSTRHPTLPEVPAMAETLPGFETVAWFGVLAPAATPRAVIEKVNHEINAILADADVKARLAGSGCDAAPGSAESFAARINGDVARWKKLAAERNIRAD
jgi:tripartite-type tricarboxylate transporter receptor subunit TctC